ncbi:hypothetical protein N5853_06245 [Bartonella sp. HY329]|uniref:hypothetical protein n=1 Tax=unclassified Bartonella TaxID=2645622 RepID=UPI0021C7D46D|nr:MULTISPECIES: hypothetical protein [unclassified Bartonella]UXM96207.1 hypothetical protein N5853_06245 [Bartonella sp. HY329]UXN10531.1 hypothetical protein N5852_06255 [Bartonella sp. HY328]
MINQKLINYLRSVYPELPFDISYVRGYTDNEIAQIERLYDIKITDQLYDFLSCMGRCSGGLFGDDPLLFYRDQWSVRGQVLFQNGYTDEVIELNIIDLAKRKPFFISIESETQYYFLLTETDNQNLVYHYDTNYSTISATQWTFNEYLRNSIDQDTRRYPNSVPLDRHGELIII